MMWFFRWIRAGLQKLNTIEQRTGVAMMTRAQGTSIDGADSFHFTLTKVENGKILKLSMPTNNPKNQFQSHSGMEEKAWVIPEGENVIEFITRALVEERIK